MNHTPGPWKVGIYRKDPSRPPTIEEIKSMLCESVDRTIARGGSIEDFYVVLSSDDPADPVHTALIGNGPTSIANAYLISAVTKLLEVCEEVVSEYEVAGIINPECLKNPSKYIGGDTYLKAKEVIAASKGMTA